MSHGAATHPFWPAVTVYFREVPLLVLRLEWYFVQCFYVAFALITRTIPAPVLVIALRRVADVAAFSQFRGFRASFGKFLVREF